MSRILYKPRKIKKRKSVLSRILFALAPILIALALVGGVVGGVAHIRGWQISQFDVSGSDAFTLGEIQQALTDVLRGNYAFVAPKASFFLVSSAAIKQKLLVAYPRLRNVSVSKEFPDRLKVTVQDRSLWAVVCSDPNVFGTQAPQIAASSTDPAPTVEPQPTSAPAAMDCFYIDDTAFAYDKAPDITGTVILRVYMDADHGLLETRVFDENRLNSLKNVLAAMEEATNDHIVSVEISSKVQSELRLKTGNGYQLYLNWDDNPQDTKKILERVLDEEIKDKRKKLDYIDLRFGNKVFYKLK